MKLFWSKLSLPVRYTLMDLCAMLVFGRLTYSSLATYLHTEALLDLVKVFELGLVVVLILIRKPTQRIDLRPFAIALALLHVFAPFYFVQGDSIVDSQVSQVVLFLGAGLVLTSLVALGVGFGIFPAYRTLRKQGPYRIVRHPIYLGHILTYLACLLENFNFNNTLALLIVVLVAHLRIVLEEKVMSANDNAYSDYKRQVPTRLVPLLY